MVHPTRTSKPSFLSVFSGLGGIDLGLESAGFRSIGCLEVDRLARASLVSNRAEWDVIEPGEVVLASKVLTPRALKIRKRQLFLLAGGPPCQPFSKAAQWSPTARMGLRDDRAKCLTGFLSLIETFLPRAILIENVQGFVSGKTSARAKIVAGLNRINRKHNVKYRLQHWIVNAADYGVPQRRSRAILFAERGGMEIEFPAPTHLQTPITAWDAIGKLAGSPAESSGDNHWLKLLPTIPEGNNYLWHTPRGGGKPLFGYRTRFWSFLLKLAKDSPAWTLPAQPGPFTGPFHWDNRVLTIEEMLRLQSFPITWKVVGSRREQIRQIGNATPPLLAEVIGRAIKSQILGEIEAGTPILEIQRSKQPIPPPRKTLPVPDSFVHRIDNWPDHPGTGRGPKPVAVLRENDFKKTSKRQPNGRFH